MILALAAVLQGLPDAEAVRFPPLQVRSGEGAVGVCAGVQGRAVLPFYHDRFDPGLGVTLEFDVLFRPPPPRPGGADLGDEAEADQAQVASAIQSGQRGPLRR